MNRIRIQPSIFSRHFLALTHHQLGNYAEARAWIAKAVLPMDAPCRVAMIDRYLRREVKSIQLAAHRITLAERLGKLGSDHAMWRRASSDSTAAKRRRR